MLKRCAQGLKNRLKFSSPSTDTMQNSPTEEGTPIPSRTILKNMGGLSKASRFKLPPKILQEQFLSISFTTTNQIHSEGGDSGFPQKHNKLNMAGLMMK